jgi:hypothetical protein
MQHYAHAKYPSILSKTNLVFLKFSFDPFRWVGAFKQFNLFKVAKFRPFVAVPQCFMTEIQRKRNSFNENSQEYVSEDARNKKQQNAIKCKMLFRLFRRLSIFFLMFVWLIFMDHLKIGLRCGLWNLNLFWRIKKSFLSSIAAFKAY